MTKKLAVISLLTVLLGATAPLAQAHGFDHGGGHGYGHEGWGHGYGYGPRFSFGLNFGLPVFYPSPYYYSPAPVYVEQAPTVIYETAPALQPSQSVYRYYCPATSAFYPAVPTCVQPWMKVAPDGGTYN